MPLGLVKLKQGTYSVELASGGTTLTPFKAVVKPSSASLAADSKEPDSTFQKLPQSSAEPIEATGNAAFPEQVNLVTEDDKSNQKNSITTISSDLAKNENKPFENQRSFLTADQVNGQKAVVFDDSSIINKTNNNQTQGADQDPLRLRPLPDSSQDFSDVSGNQPLAEASEGFSSSQNFINNNLTNEQGVSSNNALVSSQDTTSTNEALQSSTTFGVSQDGRPITQNAPLGFTPDGTPITQSFDLDQNGLPITQNRPLDGSSETFSSNSQLQNGESQGAKQNENIQIGSALGQVVEYQQLPEAISANELEQTGNFSSGNTAFENYDQQTAAPEKLQDSNLPGESKNNNFIESEGAIYSENKKLTDSTIFNSGSGTENIKQNQSGEYQRIPDTNVKNNLDTSSFDNNRTPLNAQMQSGDTIGQYNSADLRQTKDLDQASDRVNQTSGQTSQAGQAAGTSQVGRTSGQVAPNDDLPSVLDQKVNNIDNYQTRTIGTSDNVVSDETDIENFDIAQNIDTTSRILSSSIAQQNVSQSGTSDISSIGQEEQQNNQTGYVQVGNIYSERGTPGSSEINNFSLNDLPNDFYEYKGSRDISNEELLDEFLNSEQFKKLDEESKSRVVNVKQEIQNQQNTLAQNQQDGVTPGTVLSGGLPIDDKTKNLRGFAKLFTRNKQNRPTDKAQEQIQRQFEESNSLKQKASLTLNKVFGSNDKSISIPGYETLDQQSEQSQNAQNEDQDDDVLQTDDYQFGDEDNVINKYPRITGARETLDEDYQEELRKRRRKRRNLRYLPVGANLESKFLQTSNESSVESLPDDQETGLYRGLIGERDRFQNLTISEQEQNKIALRKAEHDIQQQLNKALEENTIIKEKAENQASELNADSETMFYKELIKERERFQEALSEEREQNKAALRRSEEQIQRQLIDVLTSNPQSSPTQTSNDPISQVVRSLVDSGKDKEEIIIDATRIIQMIQNNQTVAGGQEIDEFLLRQRIERELKYEFKQMQIEHEQKMKLIYRRMIEDMYIDMLNS